MSAADKIKLDGIENGANKTIVDSELSGTSVNPVENKAVSEKFLEIDTSLRSKVENSSKGVSDALNLLVSETVIPEDSDYFIIQTNGGNEDAEDPDNNMVRKPMRATWDYVENKLHPRILEEAIDYGGKLPSSPVNGQLFFQETTATSLLNLMYPVGSVYISVNGTDPTILFGGKWEEIEGRFLLGADSTYKAGTTGGEATHKLTVNEMPKHKHDWRGYTKVNYGSAYAAAIFGQDLVNTDSGDYKDKGPQSVGDDQPHNNMPPYLVVYMWKRVE